MPQRRAAYSGAGRLDAYTIPLELQAIVTRHFPADIRFEQVIRVALPLTVRRQPDRCGVLQTPARSGLSSMSAMRVDRPIQGSIRTARRVRRVPNDPGLSAEWKHENELPMPSKELNRTFNRKAASPTVSPVWAGNPLSLAKFWQLSTPTQEKEAGWQSCNTVRKAVNLGQSTVMPQDEFPSFQSDL